MNDLMQLILSPDFIASVFRVSTPIIIGTMAAYISNKAGMINIAIEGFMLLSALFGVILSAQFHDPWLAFFITVVIGALLGLLMGYLSEVLKAPIFLTGLAINMLAAGASIFILYMVTGDRGNSASLKSYNMPNIDIPVIKDIPVVGTILSGHNVITYMSFLIVFLMYVFVNKTRTGLRMRSVGENELAAKSVGIKTLRLKLLSISISGALSAIAGCYLSMGYLSMFTVNMTSGRGFIALCANAMSGGSALGGMLVSLIFGVSDTIANFAQQTVEIPSQIILMIPYAFVILCLVVYMINKNRNLKKRLLKLANEK
jgi:simple sugar transport system permease protein